MQLDVRDREVVLAGGERVAFDALLVATGSRNRKLDVPGASLPGVFDLRTAADAERIKEAAVDGARSSASAWGSSGRRSRHRCACSATT